MLDKSVGDGLVVHPEVSARALKMNFTEDDTFGFFWFSTCGQSAPRGRTVHAWSWTVLFSPLYSP
jgi:hypothetical protein